MGGDIPRRLNYSHTVSDSRERTLRIAWTLVLPLAVAGCSSNWQAYQIDTECQKVPYFTDADGDGWGDPADPGTLACTGGPSSARNNRDCNDNTDEQGASITGRIGALCPDQLVAQSGATQFAPVISGSEFVAVDGDTSLVWADAAAEACGTYGWGGHLATFRDASQLKTVLAGLGSQDVYAGWVGYSPVVYQTCGSDSQSPCDRWGSYDENGKWVEDTSAGTFQVPLCACVAPDADPATCADKYTADLGYLALIRHRAGGSTASEDNWCLGTPDEADVGDATPQYSRLYGHFICGRAIPDPLDYSLAQLPSDATQ